MSITAFLEKVLVGKQAVERRGLVSREIFKERGQLEEQRELLRGDVKQLEGEVRQLEGNVRQHAQIVDSGSRVMNTITHAMIMVEAGRGKPEK